MSSMLSSPATARIVPFAIYIAFLALSGVLGDAVSFDARWLYPLRVGIVALALVFFWKHYDELRGRVAMPGGFWALSLVVGIVVFLLWVNLSASWMFVGEAGKGFDPRDGEHVNVALALFRVAGAALVVPVMEELFWRSFVMRWIDNQDFQKVVPTLVTLKAVLLSSLVFGFEHHEWFAGVLAGLAYAWLYRATGNLWAPVFAHGVTNGMLGMWVLYTRSWQFW